MPRIAGSSKTTSVERVSLMLATGDGWGSGAGESSTAPTPNRGSSVHEGSGGAIHGGRR